MDPLDLRLRNATYRLVVDLGRVPTEAEVARTLGWPEQQVVGGWRRLHDDHALVLDDSSAIRMANPFAGPPTPHRVQVGGREWFANCAWDAFGVCAALHGDGTIRTVCPDCSGELTVEVRGGLPSDATLVFHCLVPAAGWWEDIGFT
jgi:hypothetical protein